MQRELIETIDTKIIDRSILVSNHYKNKRDCTELLNEIDALLRMRERVSMLYAFESKIYEVVFESAEGQNNIVADTALNLQKWLVNYLLTGNEIGVCNSIGNEVNAIFTQKDYSSLYMDK